MAYTTIDDPSEYFHTQLFTGTGSQRNITNDANAGDFQPDWVWIKGRSIAEANMLYDSTRGVTKDLRSETTAGDNTNAQGLQAFNSDGFQIGTLQNVNNNTSTYVSWQWKANGGTTASNTDGSVTSTVQANTEAGFSIVTYTGTGSNATIGHGLGVAPKMIIQKNRDETQPWWTYVEFIGAGGQLRLNGTNAAGSDGGVLWNSTAPTSSVFSVGDNTGTNGSSDKCIAYCFAEKQGYSKIGKYIGNGNANGTFVYTGFKPAWVMLKRTDNASGTDWGIHDAKRSPFNTTIAHLNANDANAEGNYTSTALDFVSNGFKVRTNNPYANASGGTYFYYGFCREHHLLVVKECLQRQDRRKKCVYVMANVSVVSKCKLTSI